MNDTNLDLAIYRGKANNIQLESIHGKVADTLDKAIDAIEIRFNKRVIQAKAQAEEDNTPYEEPEFYLSKEDLAVLVEAQKFLKNNNVEMSVVKKSGSKAFSSKIHKFNKDKRDIIIS